MAGKHAARCVRVLRRAFEGTGQADAVTYQETALGADASWDRGGGHVQGELLYQQRRYRAGERAARGAGFWPDGST